MSCSHSRQRYQHTCCCSLLIYVFIHVVSMLLTFHTQLCWRLPTRNHTWAHLEQSCNFSRPHSHVNMCFLSVQFDCKLRMKVCMYVLVCHNLPCPSGSVVLCWGRRLLCQWWCPAGTRQWGGAPTPASHPPWLTFRQRCHSNWRKGWKVKDGPHTKKICILIQEYANLDLHFLQQFLKLRMSQSCCRFIFSAL